MRSIRSWYTVIALGFSATIVHALPPGGAGTVTIVRATAGLDDAAHGIAMDPDGRFLLAGMAHAGGRSVIAALTRDGAPDSIGFGGLGTLIYDFSVGEVDQLNAIARAPTGGYAACGSQFDTGTNIDFLVARFAADGSLDPSFGYVQTPFLTDPAGGAKLVDQCNAVAVQADGKVIAAGVTSRNGPQQVALARYNTNGTLDMNFGSAGLVVINASNSANGESAANAVAVLADGHILVAGYGGGQFNSDDFLLMRLKDDGSPDGTFATSGKVLTPVGSSEDIANAMAVQADGRIVLAGSAIMGANLHDFALVRYTSAGALDTTFGSGGIVTTPIGPGHDYAYAVAVMPWGRIVAAGSARIDTTSAQTEFALAAYNSNGSLDAYFGDHGKSTLVLSTGIDGFAALAADVDGARMWAAGTTLNGTDYDLVAVEVGLADTIFRYGFEVP